MLTTPAIRAVVTQGPHPSGPSASAGSKTRATLGPHTATPPRVAHPNVAYYLPRLASRLGIKAPSRRG